MKLVAAVLALSLVCLAACGASAAEIKQARTARYNADIATIVPAISRAMHLYGLKSEDGGRRLETAWRQVSATGNGEGFSGEVSGPMQAPTNRAAPPRAPSNRAAVNRYFERYSIRIVGERPFSVAVEAYAAKWSPGYAEPTRLNGEARPDWLDDRRDHLVLAIHKELKPYEIQSPVAPPPHDAPPSSEPSPTSSSPSSTSTPPSRMLSALED